MNITPFINAIALLLAALITSVIIPYIKSKTTLEQQKEINAWVKTAVVAAEQTITGSGKGDEKREFVFEFLNVHGITYDENKVRAILEAAVYQLKNGVIPIE